MDFNKHAMKKQNTFIVVFAVLFVVSLVTYIILVLNGFLEAHIGLFIILSLLIPFFLCMIAFNIGWAIAIKKQIKEATQENRNALGLDHLFFNYNIFERRIRELDKKLRNKEAFVIVFSPTNYVTSTNLSKNSIIKELNKEVALIVEDSVSKENIISYKECSFCYYERLFVMCVYSSQDKVEELIEHIRKSIFEMAERKELKVLVSPFFGVSEYKDKDIYVAIQNAMFARRYAENNYQDVTYYTPMLRKEASYEEIDEMRKALLDGEFEVYYQPKYSLAEKRFVSAEALIRWNSPKYGLVSPAKFVEKAELGGLIHELDLFVFNTVCKKLHDDRKANKRCLPVSVNFSLYEFYNPAFVKTVFDTLDENLLAPELIEIEITETTTQANTFMATSILRKLKDYGLKISMDDFGSGFSSLSNLNRMPFDIVKIDKSIIDGIVSDSKSYETVKLIVGLCKANGMKVVAEGVDKEEEVSLLKKVKCDMIQGFYYSKPIPSEEYDKFLIENNFETKEAKGL